MNYQHLLLGIIELKNPLIIVIHKSTETAVAQWSRLWVFNVWAFGWNADTFFSFLEVIITLAIPMRINFCYYSTTISLVLSHHKRFEV